jgi:hypothetical protein
MRHVSKREKSQIFDNSRLNVARKIVLEAPLYDARLRCEINFTITALSRSHTTLVGVWQFLVAATYFSSHT